MQLYASTQLVGFHWLPTKVKAKIFAHYCIQNATLQLHCNSNIIFVWQLALAVTALLALAGYLVQAKASQRTIAAQHTQIQEAAERDKSEVRAGKQLDRVQAQMELFLQPIHIDMGVRQNCRCGICTSASEAHGALCV